MGPSFFFSGSLVQGKGSVYTSQPDVQVAENNCEWARAMRSSGWGLGGCTLWFGAAFFSLILVLSVAVKLSCTYSGFSSPRVEWKFVQGDTTTLVCYNSQITGKLSYLLRLQSHWHCPAWVPGVGTYPEF